MPDACPAVQLLLRRRRRRLRGGGGGRPGSGSSVDRPIDLDRSEFGPGQSGLLYAAVGGTLGKVGTFLSTVAPVTSPCRHAVQQQSNTISVETELVGGVGKSQKRGLAVYIGRAIQGRAYQAV